MSNLYPNIGELKNIKNNFFIAEMSGNHNKSFDRAIDIVEAAHRSGANAVKLQTYTPDTITMDSKNINFLIKGTLWDGMTLHDLYSHTFMPWEWQKDLRDKIKELDMLFISTPFDYTAVDFLYDLDVDAFKIASPEIIDIPLLKYISDTGKPIILSTGMATLGEIEKAINTISKGKSSNITLLKCTSAYPAPVEQMNLSVLPVLSKLFSLPVGLSDHSMGNEAALVAASLGAVVFEKHLTLSRMDGGLDSDFSIEPAEFKSMVDSVKIAKSALGEITFGPTTSELIPYKFRRSIYVVKPIKKGDILNNKSVMSIRPGGGLLPEYFDVVIGKVARYDLEPGTPLNWTMLENCDD
jgi:pseudaminic acid synthase